MSIVPASKQDFDACERLATASDDEVRAHIRELLTWLQDMNWPVAPLVARRIGTLGSSLAAPLREILRGSDDVWKHWIVSSLLPAVDGTVAESLRAELDRIVTKPTSSEAQEDLPGAVLRLRQKTTIQ
jgi:hypothetical protein